MQDSDGGDPGSGGSWKWPTLEVADQNPLDGPFRQVRNDQIKIVTMEAGFQTHKSLRQNVWILGMADPGSGEPRESVWDAHIAQSYIYNIL